MTIANALRGKRNHQSGQLAELLTLRYLESLGVKCAHLETGWRVQRVGKRIVGATPVRPVLADIVGVINGRAVLVEVKKEDRLVLSMSRLEPHQQYNLTRWADAGALVFVAWVQGVSVHLIPWPDKFWAKGNPIGRSTTWITHTDAVFTIRQHKEESA